MVAALNLLASTMRSRNCPSLHRAPAYRDKPVLSAVEVEDVVAYLMTLK